MGPKPSIVNCSCSNAIIVRRCLSSSRSYHLLTVVVRKRLALPTSHTRDQIRRRPCFSKLNKSIKLAIFFEKPLLRGWPSSCWLMVMVAMLAICKQTFNVSTIYIYIIKRNTRGSRHLEPHPSSSSRRLGTKVAYTQSIYWK